MMDEQDFEELARDPRFISGIYNYCDRWCERCPFTSRCMNYALSERELERLESKDSEKQEFWDKLDEAFETAMEWEEDEETDFDCSEEDIQESMCEQAEIHEAAQSQPYSRTARRYIDMVDNWFKAYGNRLDARCNDPESPAQDDTAITKPVEHAAGIQDYIEVIRWYQSQIWVKLCRAATGTIHANIEEEEGFQGDADGSAKVAIIGIERSIAAWATLLSHFPDHEDAIFSLHTLKRLLRHVEAAFPNARAFRRPGFDITDDE